jgi:hypothetical protein
LLKIEKKENSMGTTRQYALTAREVQRLLTGFVCVWKPRDVRFCVNELKKL